MNRWLKRILWGALALVVLAYAGICVWLRTNESRIAFSRWMPYVTPSPTLALNETRVEFGDDGAAKCFAWIIPASPEDSSDAWLIFFHGAGDNVSIHANAYDDFRAMGFNVMAAEYPGYLDSPGVPSETIVEREAKAAYDYLVHVKHVPAKKIAIYGASLGAAFAIDLGSRVDAGALIVVSAFSSGVEAGQRMFPILPMRLLLQNRFESDEKIGHARMPVLVIHSVDDTRFPLAENGRRLFELAPSPKQLLRIHGAHGATQSHATVNPDFFADIAAFLNAHAGFALHRALPSIAPVIAAAIDRDGKEAAATQYRRLSEERPSRYNFREAELDRLASELLEKRKMAEAIAILRLNTEHFPQSYAAFESLGDAYVAAGKKVEAEESYKRSLALLSGAGNNSAEKLARLQGSAKGDPLDLARSRFGT